MAAHLKRLGARLADLRDQAGYTQEDAAHRLDVSLRTIQNWEHGLSMPYRRNLRAAEKLYGLAPGSLEQELPGFSLAQRDQLDRIEEKVDELLRTVKGDDAEGVPDALPPGPGDPPDAPGEDEQQSG